MSSPKSIGTAKDLSDADRDLLRKKDITEAQLHQYRATLEKGLPPVKILANATAGDGIHVLSPPDAERYAGEYRDRLGVDVMKFVPASGAASRMFKDLLKYLESGGGNEVIDGFFRDLHKYPFHGKLTGLVDLAEVRTDHPEDRKRILRYLLHPEGMNYAQLPKGAILFHRYEDGTCRTAFEEHFHEAALYADNKPEGKARIHFTLPDKDGELISEILHRGSAAAGDRYNIEFDIESDPQKPSTDTPAIDTESGQWAREESGALLFRPAGHGALLDNLNGVDADVVFVKNIDNVVPDRLKNITVAHKERLGGVLLHVRNRLFSFLNDLDAGRLNRRACVEFLEKWFGGDFGKLSDTDLREVMDRPLRVCGMVKNEGEPGGGPFYVEGPDGPSLQIVEKAQIDLEDAGQMEIFRKATHFNPVDLVLSIKDHRGRKFDLHKFSNPDTAMVVDKSHLGRPIKALELPGLWNGAMYHWNTLFVEVPIETFNPVKTVFDLVRANHLT